MKIENRTHRFSEYTKIYNSVLEPSSFSYQSSRRASYQQRLYFEYLYTQKVGGSTFFYTLTYNNKHIPHYRTKDGGLDFPCFSYEDIRLVTNGKLSKILLRQYGSRLRYFCACETGEGKGIRGEFNNPHYHFIFFVQPLEYIDNSPNSDYKPISPFEFRALIRELWHGTNKSIRYENCRFGIAKEGDNCGVVTGIAPFRYVSKYVLKDNNELDNENLVVSYWTRYYKFYGVTLDVLWYFYKVNLESRDGVHDPEYNRELFDMLGLSSYNKYRKQSTDPDKSYSRYVSRYADLSVKSLYTQIHKFFITTYLYALPKLKLREYINFYSGKVRCSKSLGEYGLNFVEHVETSPIMKVPKNGTYDIQTPCLFYYRKLYYQKYMCDVTGNVLYRLNDLGKKLKMNSLSDRVSSLANKVKESISILYTNNERHLYETSFNMRKTKVLNELVKSPMYDSILEFYAIYKLVYEFRQFNYRLDFIALDDCFTLEQVKKDYYKFLTSDSYFYDYQFCRIMARMPSYLIEGYISFDCHPCISPYLKYFKVLEETYDSILRYRSECAKIRFKENKGISQRINESLHSLQ